MCRKPLLASQRLVELARHHDGLGRIKTAHFVPLASQFHHLAQLGLVSIHYRERSDQYFVRLSGPTRLLMQCTGRLDLTKVRDRRSLEVEA